VTTLFADGTLGQKLKREDRKLHEEIMNFCRHIAGNCQTSAVSICGHYALWPTTGRTAIQVLLVVRDFPPRVMNYIKNLDSKNLIVLAVDQWVFERDVDKGFLGEALAGDLIFPYESLINEEYLHVQEVKLKRRLVMELLQSLILDYPELSYEFYIEPMYFALEAMLTRARLYPPMLYALSNFLKESRESQDINRILLGFLEALTELERQGTICFWKDYVRISKEFVDSARVRRYRFTYLFKTGQRALFTSLLNIFPQLFNIFFQSRESFLDLQKFVNDTLRAGPPIEDPESRVFVKTGSGFAPLTNRMDIEAFARKVLAAGKDTRVDIQSMGGILNDVYLVSVGGGTEKVVVKRFRDWSNFKWFPLTLWSAGTRTFAVLGRSRLERECAINQLLCTKGFDVPKLLHVSPSERLVFMEYIDGQDFGNVIRKAADSKVTAELEKNLELIRKVGEMLAAVHAVGVALGDTKPENILVNKENKIYLTDFEQASRIGDKVWDIAEFLYYAGHDISPFTSTSRIESIANAFIRGYLRSGGNLKTVKNAGNPRYTKVFSVFTFPHVMLALSNVCRRAQKPSEQ
jgi:tRNA A-37 threonylcarbamoyl transferase component Bud32